VRQLTGPTGERADALFSSRCSGQTLTHDFSSGARVLVFRTVECIARRNDVTPRQHFVHRIGWATARGGLHQLVKAYWSPLYPFCSVSFFASFIHPWSGILRRHTPGICRLYRKLRFFRLVPEVN